MAPVRQMARRGHYKTKIQVSIPGMSGPYPSCMDLALAISLRAVDRLPPERMPAVATDALAAGYDSPSLRVLAGLTNTDPRDTRELFDQAMAELDLASPPIVDAVLDVARYEAERGLAGEIPLVDVVRKIWWLFVDELWTDFTQDRLSPPLDRFGTFAVLSDDWDSYRDVPFIRERIERDIRGELEWLLDRGPPDAYPWSADLEYRKRWGWRKRRGWRIKSPSDSPD